MSYMTAQGLLKTLLLTCPSFGVSDVTEGDLRIQDTGSTNLCILFPGNLIEYDTAGMIHEHTWEAFADLFTKFVDDTSYNTFGALRDAVIATIDADPSLSETYFVTAIRGDGDPYEVRDETGGGPYFIGQRLRITIREDF